MNRSRTVLPIRFLLLTSAFVAGCGDLFVEPASQPTAGITLALSLAGGAAGGAPEAFDKADDVRIRLVRADQSVVLDTTVALSSPGGSREATVAVEPASDEETLSMQVLLEFGGQPLFDGGGTVTVRRNETSTAQVSLTPVVAGILLPPEFPTITAIGDQITLTGAAVFATGDTVRGAALTYSTPDVSILSVTPDGTATALAEGQARIFASAAGMTGTSLLVVHGTVTAVQIDAGSLDLNLGEQHDLQFDAYDANGNALLRTASWNSTAPQVATVDANGRVTAIAAGMAKIIATVESRADTVDVTVRSDPVVEVVVDPPVATVTIGQFTTFSVTATRASGAIVANPAVVWSSSDVTVATIDPATGVAVGVAAGVTTISATFQGVTGTASLAVQAGFFAPPPGPITFNTTTAVDPIPAVVQLTSGNSVVLRGLSASIQYVGSKSGWLTASLSSTSTPAQLTVSVNVAGLGPSTYEAMITISSTTPGVAAFDIAVTLEIAQLQHTLRVLGGGVGAGSVSSTPPGIACDIVDSLTFGDCTEDYPDGTIVTLQATASQISSFTGWSGACTGSSGPCQVTMSQAQDVVAGFDLPLPPEVATDSVTNITPGLALVWGNVLGDGQDYDVWFEYSTDPLFSNFSSTSVSTVNQNTNAFCLTTVCDWYSGVSYSDPPGTVYYVRIAARNARGTARGGVLSFIVP